MVIRSSLCNQQALSSLGSPPWTLSIWYFLQVKTLRLISQFSTLNALQELAIGIGGIKLLNKDTHTLINSAFSANLYFNQLTEWSYTGKGLKLVIDEGEGGLVRTLEMITASVCYLLVTKCTYLTT